MNECLNCNKKVKNKYCNVSCQNIHQNSIKNDKKYGKYQEFNVKCESCNKSISTIERNNLFPQKEKYYCDRKCANKRVDNKSDTKNLKCERCNFTKQINKRSCQKVCNECKLELNPKRKLREIKISICKSCKKEISDKKERTFCSRSCGTIYKNIHLKIGTLGGLRSVQSQSQIRRSKNEIAFADLCISKFKNVKINDPMFNGWDADVIIEDLKIAVLWNGAWHYKQISRSQSLEQIQNRDKIKINEILNHGYKPYVIKDMGKHNIEKVNQEFNIFLEWINENS